MNPCKAGKVDHGIPNQDLGSSVTLSAMAYEEALANHAALLADRDHLLSLLRTAKASRFDFMANDPLQRNIDAALAHERSNKSLQDFVDGQSIAETAPEVDSDADDDWIMNPCHLGHRDVGAGMGIAMCNICKEKICRETTAEAYTEWNRTHPEAKVA
ncbi:hypothetical protein [Pseudomonas serbica]|uniref:hypothetical protein n=1 Tax=Pseudomonas serbica TaxID=2965074 RepID=UPI00237A1D6A|nr:hypothetical protein [Pseudomonas serbica]